MTSLRQTRRLLALAYIELGRAQDPRFGLTSVDITQIPRREQRFDGSAALRQLTDPEVDAVLKQCGVASE